MSTLWKFVLVGAVVTLTGCFSREVVHETSVAQPVVERERVVVQPAPVVERERTVIVPR